MALMANRAFITRWESGSQNPLNSGFELYLETVIGALEDSPIDKSDVMRHPSNAAPTLANLSPSGSSIANSWLERKCMVLARDSRNDAQMAAWADNSKHESFRLGSFA